MRYILLFLLFVCNATLNLTSVASNLYANELHENHQHAKSYQLGRITSISISATDVRCFGGSDGVATVSVLGTPPYSFLWNDPLKQTTPTATNLKAGTYIVTVMDIDGNTVSGSITVKEPNALDVSVIVNDITTYGGNDGSVIFNNPKGGSGSYEYSVNGTQWSSNNIVGNLKAGIYSMQIRDANVNSCVSIKGNYELREQVKISANVLSLNVSCFGANDGSIRLSNVNNGIPPYSFSINGGFSWSTGNYFDGLAPGVYNVAISDSKNSISVVGSITIIQPEKINATISVTAETFAGAKDGSISFINAKGGSGSYEYSVDGITWFTNKIDNLKTGIYNVQMRDAAVHSCVVSLGQVEIEEPAKIIADVTSTPVTCFGANDGTININNTQHGIPPYQYSLNGLAWQVTNIFIGLKAGVYELYASDANNCVSTLSIVIITEPAPLQAVVTATSETFAGAKDGAITISSPKGGSGSYEFSIDGTNWSSSSQFTSITSGTYTIRVRDRNVPACQLVFSKTIQPTGTLIADVTQANVLCNGGNTGSILFSNASGATVIEFSIDNGVTWNNTGVFNGLAAGDYEAVIRDANNIINKVSLGKVKVTEPTKLLAVFGNFVPPKCAGQTGSFSISAIGGTPPYSGIGDFVLQSGVSRTYIISDRNGCVERISVSMPDPPKIVTTAVINSPNYCNENGTIVISATGGTGALSGTGTFIIQAGKAYSFKVTDANGCSSNIISGIMPTSENSNGMITITPTITEIDFQKQQLGAIDLQVTGGTESYTYQWSNGAVTKNIHDLQNGGTYTVTVTDSNGCSLTKSFTLAIPNYVPVAKVGPDQIVYEGVTVTLDGTASVDANQDALTYIWDAPKGILLSNANSGKPSFLAPEVKRDTIITFTLVVNDGKLNSAPATVKVAIQNVIKVGTTSFESINLAIYPNPTKGIIKIIGLPEKSNPILIYTSEGKLIQKKIWKSTSGIIDISNQASGSYFLVINQQTFKIIKE